MRGFSCAIPAILLASAIAHAAPPAVPAGAYQIAISKFQFKPARLQVPVGATVVWTNLDEDPHTVTSVGGQFKASPGMDTGDSFRMRFDKPGTYAYFCSVHPFMTATIVVK